MGARHAMVDQERQTIPISGTAIRSAPLNHLHFLEPCVRAYFVRRVVLIGAESTGKTTLAAELAEHFGTTWVPEYGREHWERKLEGLTMSDPLPNWTVDEFRHIAQVQQSRERLAAGVANRVLICDTNAFATGTWYERYFGCRDEKVDAIGSQDRADLYLLAAPDIPFVQDGFRDGETIRLWMHERFRDQLFSSTVPWIELQGDFANRRRMAEEAVVSIGGRIRS